ncbi:MAG: hypothetical protein JXL97_00030 [Bacteroidales bacterium]|nr:hypothetical protein [Bacteroidales bacterium]
MKKNLFLTLLISFSLIIWSCGTNNSTNDEDENENTEIKTNNYEDEYDENDIDDNVDDIIGDEFEFIGTYESKTGVMVDISCYCFQVGYFYANNGEEFVVCFPDGMEEPSCSENLRIDGYFEVTQISPEETSPCSEGERELFYVTEYECM